MLLATTLRQTTWKEYHFHVPSVEKSSPQEIHCHITKVNATKDRHKAKRKSEKNASQVNAAGQGHSTGLLGDLFPKKFLINH